MELQGDLRKLIFKKEKSPFPENSMKLNGIQSAMLFGFKTWLFSSEWNVLGNF